MSKHENFSQIYFHRQMILRFTKANGQPLNLHQISRAGVCKLLTSLRMKFELPGNWKELLPNPPKPAP